MLKADTAAWGDRQIRQSVLTAANIDFCPKSGFGDFAYSDFRELAGLIKMPKRGVRCGGGGERTK